MVPAIVVSQFEKKGPEKFRGHDYLIKKVMTLQTPISVCLPPPLNIYRLLFHSSANMEAKSQLGKFFYKKLCYRRNGPLKKAMGAVLQEKPGI